MAIITGFVGRVGAVSGAEPAGRLSIIDPADNITELGVVSCNSGAMLDVAIAARTLGQRTQVNTGSTTAPNFVAASIQMI